MRIHSLILVLFLLLTVACNSATQSVPVAQVPASAQTPVAIATDLAATATTASTDTPTQTPTETPIAATPTLEPASATQIYVWVTKGGLMTMTQMIPAVGQPLQSWHDVPILSSATAGQEFAPTIYRYEALATFDQARQFYTDNSKSLGLTTSGPESFDHGPGFLGQDITFLGYKLTIIIVAYNDAAGHVSVGISLVP